MLKKEKNGFTMVELLGVLVVLAIIFGLAVTGYVTIKNGIRKTYYSGLEESILMAAGEYYNYNDGQVPKVFGEEQKVKLSKLIGDKYIDKVIDQTGKDCDFDASFVRVYKNENNAISYDVCLKCNHDEYSSEKCSEMFSYSIELSGTIGKRVGSNIVDTKAIYQESKYVNSPVILHVRTTEKMNGKTIVIKKQDNASYEKTCTVGLQSNKTYGCSVNVETSGLYIGYGVVNSDKTKEKSINVLIDEVKPTFIVNETTNNGTRNITSDKGLSNIVSSNLSINVSEIKDNLSGIKSIRYAFYKKGTNAYYTNIDNTSTNFSFNKPFEKGEYNLVISVTDIAGNNNTYEKSYKFNEKLDENILTTVCKNLIYNGHEQVLTNNITGIIYSNNKGTNAGSYSVTVKLDNYYIWSDETNENKIVSCIINRLGIEFPNCSDKIYTSSEQTLFDGHTSGTYTNNILKGTNVNNYTINLTPSSNHQWNSGANPTAARGLTCKVIKSNTVTTLNNQTVEYTGSNISISGATSKLSSNNVAINDGTYEYAYYSNNTCTISITSPIEAGTYYVKATLKETTNYNASTSGCATLTIKNLAENGDLACPYNSPFCTEYKDSNDKVNKIIIKEPIQNGKYEIIRTVEKSNTTGEFTVDYKLTVPPASDESKIIGSENFYIANVMDMSGSMDSKKFNAMLKAVLEFSDNIYAKFPNKARISYIRFSRKSFKSLFDSNTYDEYDEASDFMNILVRDGKYLVTYPIFFDKTGYENLQTRQWIVPGTSRYQSYGRDEFLRRYYDNNGNEKRLSSGTGSTYLTPPLRLIHDTARSSFGKMLKNASLFIIIFTDGEYSGDDATNQDYDNSVGMMWVLKRDVSPLIKYYGILYGNKNANSNGYKKTKNIFDEAIIEGGMDIDYSLTPTGTTESEWIDAYNDIAASIGDDIGAKAFDFTDNLTAVFTSSNSTTQSLGYTYSTDTVDVDGEQIKVNIVPDNISTNGWQNMINNLVIKFQDEDGNEISYTSTVSPRVYWNK